MRLILISKLRRQLIYFYFLEQLVKAQFSSELATYAESLKTMTEDFKEALIVQIASDVDDLGDLGVCHRIFFFKLNFVELWLVRAESIPQGQSRSSQTGEPW